MFTFGGLISVTAQSFLPPQGPAPDNALLGQFNFVNYLELQPQGSSQEIRSPLHVNPEGVARAYLSDGSLSAALVGVAGPSVAPALSSFSPVISSAGAYGFASGAGENYGAYGFSSGGAGGPGNNPGVGVYARTTSGIAAQFYGAVRVFPGQTINHDSLEVSGTNSAHKIYAGRLIGTTSIVGNKGVSSGTGITVAGTFLDGIRGIATGGCGGAFNPTAPCSYGVYGSSSGNSGISIVAGGSLSGETKALEASTSAVGGHGVYGLAEKGNGVTGLIQNGASGGYAVKGFSAGTAVDASRGVYGYSKDWAFVFKGDMEIPASASIFLGARKLDEDTLSKLLRWCFKYGTAGVNKCDNYCVNGLPNFTTGVCS